MTRKTLAGGLGAGSGSSAFALPFAAGVAAPLVIFVAVVVVVAVEVPACELSVDVEVCFLSDLPKPPGLSSEEFGFGLGFVVRIGSSVFLSFDGGLVVVDFFSNSTMTCYIGIIVNYPVDGNK